MSAVSDGLFNIFAAFPNIGGLSSIRNTKTRHAVMTGTNCSPDVMRMIRTRRIRRTGLVAHMGKGEVYTGFWWANLREGDHLEDPGVDGRIILRWIFKNWEGRIDGIDLS